MMEGGALRWRIVVREEGVRARTTLVWWRVLTMESLDDGHALERGYLGFCQLRG
jgi:hypothetical protein